MLFLKWTVVGLVLNKLLYTCAVTIENEVCGFEQKCAGNRTVTDSNARSCCKPCECENFCRERDTCCSDMKNINSVGEVVMQECLPALYLPPGFTTNNDVERFFVRTRCPSSYENLRIKEKCETLTPTVLEEILFVSSEDGTIIYKNRFCGLCYGEIKPSIWKEMVHVKKCGAHLMSANLTAVSLEKHLLERCPISFAAPTSLDITRTSCFKKTTVIDKCNQTGNWNFFDSKIEKLCHHSAGSVYFYQRIFKVRVYSNMYCYLCNQMTTTVFDTCRKDVIERTTDVTLFTLINQHIWKKSEVPAGKRCKTDEIFDTFLKTCRQLLCPTFYLPVDGRCVPYLAGNIVYTLTVRLTLLEHINMTAAVKNEMKTKPVILKKKLGFGNCKICQLSMVVIEASPRRDRSEFMINYDLITSESCETNYFLSTLTNVQHSPSDIRLMLNGTLIWVKVIWEKEETYLKFIPYYRVEGTGCEAISFKNGTACPRVKLEMYEYNTVNQRHPLAKELLFFPDEKDLNGTMYICCQKYISGTLGVGVRSEMYVKMTMIAFILSVAERFL